MRSWNGMVVPSSYSHSVQTQHLAIRETCGLTDMSGITKVSITGKQAQKFLNHCITRDCYRQRLDTAIYTSILNAAGSVVDDAILFRLRVSHLLHETLSGKVKDVWLICLGAGDGFSTIQNEAHKFDVEVTEYDRLHCLMLQGPNAANILTSVVDNPQLRVNLAAMKRFEVISCIIGGCSVFVARISYSGEDGYEIFADHEFVTKIWDLLLENDQQLICPVAFDSLDMKRIEAGLLIYGVDITGTQSPMELGLDFTVDYSKPRFLGKEKLILRNQNPETLLIGFQSYEKLSILPQATLSFSEAQVGKITSWGYSQWLQKTIGFAHVEPQHAIIGGNYHVACRDGEHEVTLSSRRFYQNLTGKGR